MTLPTPGFHHLHLRSTDPDAAIDFYMRQFPTTSKGEWGGIPALRSPNNVLILFEKVKDRPTSTPQSAIWHFGWHVTDARKFLAELRSRPDVELLPLYTTDEGGFVHISSDTWPGRDGVLGLTKPQIADAKANNVQPKGGSGFGYVRGLDNATWEYSGNHPAERFNHIHFYHEDVLCALLWYHKHLNAPIGQPAGAPVTEDNCKVPRAPEPTWPALQKEGMYRKPRQGVIFGDVMMNWYPNQGEQPLVSSRGQLQDHFALSVTDLDAWLAKLSGEGIAILEQPYRLGDTRAFMIEGPSREAIELVEIA